MRSIRLEPGCLVARIVVCLPLLVRPTPARRVLPLGVRRASAEQHAAQQSYGANRERDVDVLLSGHPGVAALPYTSDTHFAEHSGTMHLDCFLVDAKIPAQKRLLRSAGVSHQPTGGRGTGL